MGDVAYRSSVGSGNTNSGNVTCSHNISNFKNVSNIGSINNTVNVNKAIADEDSEIMKWLSPLEPGRRHQDVRTDRLDGVGDWILGTKEFLEWKSSKGREDKAVLFCSGNPGVGKTHISSLVIDSLCDEPGEEDIAIAMFYCDFRDQQEQTTANIMGAILKQLITGEEVLELVRTAFEKAKKKVGGRGLRLPDVVQMLKQFIAKLPRVFICIDALDECLSNHLLALLESLKDTLEVSPRTRIFVTGRPQVEAEITRYFTTMVMVPISPKTHDIRKYLERKLEMDVEPDAMSDSLRADIIRIIPERISEIFLLVSLTIDAILAEVTVGEREQKLNEISKGNHVEDAYATTVARIKAQKGSKSRLGMDALMWVSNSERPLRTSELCHALGVKIGSTDLDVKNIPTIRTLLGCSLGLIAVEAYSGTVRLVHLTLREYLSKNQSLFKSPHSIMAEVCLTYLNFQSVRELSPSLNSAPPRVPFVEYASCYWGTHTRMRETEDVSPLALKLLIGFEKHISSQLLLLQYKKDRLWWVPGFDERSCLNGFTGLHGAAFLGLVNIAAALLAKAKCEINSIDTEVGTALAWAAIMGHEGVVKMLLEREDVNPNTADTYGRTPLWWAVRHGNEGVGKLLLEREDINPNTADTEYGRTPIWMAAWGGHRGVVGLLLEREDININTADTGYGRTPLWSAARGGHEGVVGLLLERQDINVNTADTEYGRTPLWLAVWGGHEGVVGLLLERQDININTADTENGRTPLWRAAWAGHEGVVKLLLEREDINPNTADTEYGRTPLWWAAMDGHEGIVRLLLEREDTNPNTADTEYGRTPLWLAAEGGHEGVIKLLLGRDNIDPNSADTRHGQTPLWLAADARHEGVAKLLLAREDICPNTPDTRYGQTPLWLAAWGGHEGVVKVLLEREDTNPNTADAKYGQTPLWWAAEGGHMGAVKLLLEREDTNPNTADKEFGQTPLWLAAKGGHEGVARLLLEREDINPNTADTEYGQTPLWLAVRCGYRAIVKFLLERGDVNLDIPSLSGETPLELAALFGHAGIVQLLSDHKPSIPGPSQPNPSTSLSPSKPSPPNFRSLLGIAIRSFITISSLIFLVFLLILITPSLSTSLFLSFLT